jgi:peroxiredoxin
MKIILSSLLSVVLLLLASATTTVEAATKTIQVGDEFPSDLTLHFSFPPQPIDVSRRLKNKNVLLIGLPGAFTPT